jgi:CheY-like chemotaxis protein
MTIRRVMLVDDEADIRTIGELALQSIGGWEVVLAPSGAHALELARREVIDVILLDVSMPHQDGLATFAGLRAIPRLADVPIIFMTAKVHAREIAQLGALGAAGVIAKPFDPLTLPDEIRRIVG